MELDKSHTMAGPSSEYGVELKMLSTYNDAST